MSTTQLKVLWIGIAIFVLMGLFPPLEYPRYDIIPYGFILSRRDMSLSRLFIQWIIVAILTGGLIYSLKIDPELLLKIRCRILSWWKLTFTYSPKTYEELLKSEREKRKTKQGNVPPENSDK